jgi:hypothetical protein
VTTFSALASNIGKGLAAGFVGTVAMTLSSTLEARLRKREASSAPADAAAKVLGIREFDDDGARKRFGTLVHWGYGTGWGATRGLLRSAGLSPTGATLTHYCALWGSEQVALPVLDVAPPLTMWGGAEVAIDAWHHVVYVLATSAAYELLDAGE